MSFSSTVLASDKEVNASILRTQNTLGRDVSASGIGLFTGESVSIRMCPAPIGAGIVFQRVDLPLKPRLFAQLEQVHATPRCTVIGVDGVLVQTIEHIVAALCVYKIDNALIEISGAEVPIFDGSSNQFVSMIEAAGVFPQETMRPIYTIQSPIYWSQGDIHLVALPSHEYRISYTLHYPFCTRIGSQYYSVVVDQESFKDKIAPSRTFSVYEEIASMIEKGLVKGGSLDNAVIIKDNAVANPEGLRFPDEMVRHKILDLIGDLSLIPVSFAAHIIAVRSGHSSNNAFAKELFNHIKMENF